MKLISNDRLSRVDASRTCQLFSYERGFPVGKWRTQVTPSQEFRELHNIAKGSAETYLRLLAWRLQG